MNSSDSAEEIVKLSLEGMEVAIKIAGAGAKNVAVMIYTIMKDQQQTKGKTRLTNMLKTEKPLKIFTIKAEDLKKFSQEAKKYGVLYCALANKKNQKIDGMVDIMVKEEDAAKINRISERFNFARVDTATIEHELEKEKKQEKEPKERTEEDKFIDDILSKTQEKQENTQEVQSKTQNLSPSNTNNTEEKNQSEISLSTKLSSNEISKLDSKKSVRKELKEIEREVQIKEEQKKAKTLENTRKGGKHFKEPKHFENNKKGKVRERSK